MPYRDVPWQRNFRKIPDRVRRSLDQIETDLVQVAATKLVRPSEESATFGHLQFPEALGEQATTLPLREMGLTSTRNRDGWEVKRVDLPMITKTYVWETPNFGDASTYGTHIHYHDREVYQRDFNEPRVYQIGVEKLRAGTGDDAANAFRFFVDHQIDRGSPLFEEELLFMLNLLQENVGAVGVFASDASREDYLGTIHLDWRVFPPGDEAEVVRQLTQGRAFSRDEEAIVEARVRLFSRLRPRAFIQGSGGLSTYVGAQYADDLVVFENVKYGNALYVLFEGWDEVSRRSRLDLLRGNYANYHRIVHNSGWEDIVRDVLHREKRARGIRD